MRIENFHLSYCTNIHPGHTWAEVFSALKIHLPPLKAAFGDKPFGIGLRLSDAAAAKLDENPEELAAFSGWLKANGYYVFTMNGFVHGRFHGTAVKAAAYQPHWDNDERVLYTLRLARVMAELMGDEQEFGSISTSPLGFRTMDQGPSSLAAIRRRILAVLRGLARIRATTGKRIILAMEPEPACAIETTAQLCSFYRNQFLRSPGRDIPLEDEELAKEHFGICLDLCHAAVLHEEPAESLELIRSSGLTLAKVQISSALSLEKLDEEGMKALRHFQDDVYLHQVVERDRISGELRHFDDLPQALTHGEALTPSMRGQRGWRIHYHVPIFLRDFGCLSGTSPQLPTWLNLIKSGHSGKEIHCEVETYTFSVLPAIHRTIRLEDDLLRELQHAEKLITA